MRSADELRVRLAMHERQLREWQTDPEPGEPAVLPEHPDPAERERHCLRAEAMIEVLEWALEGP